jgi:hypothetical protein
MPPVAAGYWRSSSRNPYEGVRVFLFFSNRLGCGGSLLISLVITVVLLVIFVR